jgi:hypothetical protein
MGLRDLIDRIFPTEEGRRKTNELVERGLEALRLARDERAFTMGDVTRVPSRLELRISQERFDDMKGMDAVRDLEYFFNDELMRDMAAENMRTFGDHAIHVTVAVDGELGADEIYAAVLAPESGSPGAAAASSSYGARPNLPDSTRVLGSDDAPATVALDMERDRAPEWSARLVMLAPGGVRVEERLDGRQWIIGRRGASGRPLPAGYRKLDLDLRETVSREQLRVELGEGTFVVARIGKTPVMVGTKEPLGEGEQRTVSYGTPLHIDGYELVITR